MFKKHIFNWTLLVFNLFYCSSLILLRVYCTVSVLLFHMMYSSWISLIAVLADCLNNMFYREQPWQKPWAKTPSEWRWRSKKPSMIVCQLLEAIMLEGLKDFFFILFLCFGVKTVLLACVWEGKKKHKRESGKGFFFLFFFLLRRGGGGFWEDHTYENARRKVFRPAASSVSIGTRGRVSCEWASGRYLVLV